MSNPGFFTDIPVNKPKKKVAPAVTPKPKPNPKPVTQPPVDPIQTFLDQLGVPQQGKGAGVLLPGARNTVPQAPTKPVIPINRETRNKIEKSGNTQQYQNSLNNPFLDPKVSQQQYAKGPTQTLRIIDPIFGHQVEKDGFVNDPEQGDADNLLQTHYRAMADSADRLPFAMFDFNLGLRNSRRGAETTIKSKDGKRDIPITVAIDQVAKALSVPREAITTSKNPVHKFLNSMNEATSGPARARNMSDAMDEGFGKLDKAPDGGFTQSVSNFQRALFQDNPGMASDSDLATYGRSLSAVVNPFNLPRQMSGQAAADAPMWVRMTEKAGNFATQAALTGGVAPGASLAAKVGGTAARVMSIDLPQIGLMVKDSGGITNAAKGLAQSIQKPFVDSAATLEDWMDAGMSALMVFGLAHGVKSATGRVFKPGSGIDLAGAKEGMIRSAEVIRNNFTIDPQTIDSLTEKIMTAAHQGQADAIFSNPQIARDAATIQVHSMNESYAKGDHTVPAATAYGDNFEIVGDPGKTNAKTPKTQTAETPETALDPEAKEGTPAVAEGQTQKVAAQEATVEPVAAQVPPVEAKPEVVTKVEPKPKKAPIKAVETVIEPKPEVVTPKPVTESVKETPTATTEGRPAPTTASPKEGGKPQQKEPWEMTATEFADGERNVVYDALDAQPQPRETHVAVDLSTGKEYTHVNGKLNTIPAPGRVIPATPAEIRAFDNAVSKGMVQVERRVITGAGMTTAMTTKRGDKVGNVTRSRGMTPETAHKLEVQKALSEGKPVPAEVLKDYPDLAPKVKEPLNQNKTNTKGQYQFDEATQKHIITLFKSADASTITHELAHHFFETMTPEARARVISHFTGKDIPVNLADHIFKVRGKDYVKVQEAFARNWEHRLRTGSVSNAPKEVQDALDNFTQYMNDAYGEAQIPGVVDKVRLTDKPGNMGSPNNGGKLNQNKDLGKDIANLETTLKEKHGVELRLHLYKNGDLKIDHIAVPKDSRKQGIGSAVMSEITRFADDNGLRTTLTASVYDQHYGTTSQARLKKFYKRFGFVENRGKDFSISENMLRNPKKKPLEQANPQTKTPEFKEWFGDSKVVDEKGEPLVVYHGSGTKIESFDPGMTGQGNDQFGSGFYFTNDPAEASIYQGRTQIGKPDKLGGIDSPNSVDAFISIKKPIVVSGSNLSDANINLSVSQAEKIIRDAPKLRDLDESPLWNWADINNGVTDAHIRDAAKNYTGASLMSIEGDFFRDDATAFREAVRNHLGYDGVIQTFPAEDGFVRKHYVAWFPEQIKSASKNSGKFDPKNPSILHQPATRPTKAYTPKPNAKVQAYFDELLGGTGAKTAEAPVAPKVADKPSGDATHAQTEEVRKVLGMDLYEKVTKADSQTIAEAAAHRGKATALLQSDKPLTDSQTVALALDMQDALKERQTIINKYEPGEAMSESDIKLMDAHTEAARTAVLALDKSGTEAGRALRMRKFTSGADYSEMGVTQAYVKATGKMPSAETSRKIAELSARIAELEANVSVKETKAKKTFDDAVKVFERGKDALNQPLYQLTPDQSSAANRIATHLYESGMNTRDAVKEIIRLGNGVINPREASNAYRKAIAVAKGKNTRQAKAAGVPIPEDISTARTDIYRTQKELAELIQEQASKDIWAEAGLGKKTLLAAKELKDSFTSLVSSTDISGGRQSKFAMLINPKVTMRAFGNQFRAFSKPQYESMMAKMQNDPAYWDAIDHGVDLQGKPNFKEEAFASRQIEKVPVLGAVIGGSDRAYTAMVEPLRFEAYKKLAKYAKTAEEKRLVGDFVNIMTGRAGRGTTKKLIVNDAGTTVLWAASFGASRIQLTPPAMLLRLATMKAPASLKGRLLWEYTKPMATLMGIGYGVASQLGGKLETDKDSKDFGLVVLPNGDTVDVWSGQKQAARLLLDILNPSRQGGFFNEDQTIVDRVGQFFENKTNPVFKAGIGLIQRKDAIGQPFGTKEAAANFTPLSVRQAVEDMRQGRLDENAGLFALAAMGNFTGYYDIRRKEDKAFYESGRKKSEEYKNMDTLEYLKKSAIPEK